MALIVQKYGGTSVASDVGRRQILAKIRDARNRDDRVVLVVSAMGRRGAPYATDTVLDLLREFDTEPEGRTSDLLVSCCETISACLISAFLKSEGVRAVPMTAYTAGIRAQGPRGDATPTGIDAGAVQARLEEGAVPVVTGFQALDDANDIITLGRGGSDTSAVAVGVALKADFVDIYTDVPGVAKADPRVIGKAAFLDFLDYDSMFRLAQHGARVLHDRSALLAKLGRVLIRIRSTFDDGCGTLIGPEGFTDAGGRCLAVPDFVGMAFMSGGGDRQRVTAVFAKDRGRSGVAAAAAVADRFRAERAATTDPDAISFECGRQESQEFACALYDALD